MNPARHLSAGGVPSVAPENVAWLAALRTLVTQRLGLALPMRFDRQFRRAAAAAAEASGSATLEDLLAHLSATPWTAPAWQALIELATVRETSFFRQAGWWRAVTSGALVPLIEARRREGNRVLRCVSVGCASGDEPYSLAMVLDRLLAGEQGWNVEITGLDLCAAALQRAAAGLFDERAVKEVGAADRERWFQAVGRQQYCLSEDLRKRVNFRLFNLSAAAPHSLLPGAPADLVICRNVLIHVDPAQQARLARYLGRQVRPGGFLTVSPVEASPSWFAPLRFHARGQAILFERPVVHGTDAAPSRPARTTPSAPLSLGRPAARAARKTASDARGRLEQARRLADRGLFAEAKRLCQEMLDSGEDAHLMMALVLQAQGDLRGADAAAERARASSPRSPVAHYVAAIIALRAGRASEARRFLREAIRILEGGGDALDDTDLGIGADEIRQAARRLGVSAGGGGANVRSHAT